MPKLKHESGAYYARAAERGGCSVRNGRGDHVVIQAPPPHRTSMTIPMHRELANGTECAIVKWLIRVGILLPILACVLSAWLMGSF